MEKIGLRIVVQINCYNSDEYLEYVLKSIYDFADKIIIIDGAFYENIVPPVSEDMTQEIVGKFPNEERKIIYLREGAKSEVEQRNKVFQFIDPDVVDWLFIVDDDEIYEGHDLDRIRTYLEKAEFDGYRITSLDFVNSFQWVRICNHRRIFRIKDGMEYVGTNQIAYDGKLQEITTIIPEVRKFHYSYVKRESKAALKPLEIKADFKWNIEGRIFTRSDVKLLRYMGRHPEVMKDHPYRRLRWQPEGARNEENR